MHKTLCKDTLLHERIVYLTLSSTRRRYDCNAYFTQMNSQITEKDNTNDNEDILNTSEDVLKNEKRFIKSGRFAVLYFNLEFRSV